MCGDPPNIIIGSKPLKDEEKNAVKEGNPQAELTVKLFVRRILDFIGQYYVRLGGADLIIFTGGIGENSWEVREAACSNMEYFGIKIDYALNKTIRGKLQKISTPDSKVEVWVVPTNEELLIARDTLALISK